jgi:histone deacetylase 1/2
LGHPGEQILSSLRKNKFIECNTLSSLHSNFCHSCPLGKHIKLPFTSSLNNSLFPFDILHSDVWTSPVLSSSGHKYYVLFLDNYSNFLWTFPMSHKSQVYPIFQKLQAYIKTQFQREIKTIQCDNGGEYVSNNFRKMCELNGISLRYSCPYTSSQNGKAERKIRSINNIIRTLLIHASLPPSVWHHALETATYLSNILPSKLINFQSPLYMLYNKYPSYSHLRVFGCLCFPLFPSNTIHKLQPRSTPCVFLGYPSNHRGYKCLNLTTNKIIICRHVLFDESTFPYAKLHTPLSTTYTFLENEVSPYLITHLMNQGPTTSQNSQPITNSSPPNSGHTTPVLNAPPQPVRPPTLQPSLSSPQSIPTLTLPPSPPNTQPNSIYPNNLPTIYRPTSPATQNQLPEVNMVFLNPTQNIVIYILMLQNLLYLRILCLP